MMCHCISHNLRLISPIATSSRIWSYRKALSSRYPKVIVEVGTNFSPGQISEEFNKGTHAFEPSEETTCFTFTQTTVNIFALLLHIRNY
jgi:hypothetical protein